MSEGSLAKDTFGGRFVISCVAFGKLLICRFAHDCLTISIKVTSFNDYFLRELGNFSKQFLAANIPRKIVEEPWEKNRASAAY